MLIINHETDEIKPKKRARIFYKGGGAPTPVKPAAPKPAPSPVRETSKDIVQKKKAETQRMSEKKGREASLLNGGAGLEDQAAVLKKKKLQAVSDDNSLLGGGL